MQRELDKTGTKVTAIGLGAMPLSLSHRPSEEQAIRVIEAFIQLGGDFIDTANVYCLDEGDIGHNERLIAKALDVLGARDKVIVATKGGLRRPGGNWIVDGNPRWLRESCEQSLRDLNTDCIFLYQLHAIDPKIGLEPSLDELIRLRDEGKIRHIGLSNVDIAALEAGLKKVPIASVQNRCNPFDKRDFKSGLIDFCRTRGVSYIAYSPVGGYYQHTRLAEHSLLERLSRKYAASPYCVALAWLLARGDHILPIPGASKVTSIQDSMKALHVKLDAIDLDAIDCL
jgi:aryl-alcohol dehydrogenase-like predicted oxidoreductase